MTVTFRVTLGERLHSRGYMETLGYIGLLPRKALRE